jgi:hypothetical protein
MRTTMQLTGRRGEDPAGPYHRYVVDIGGTVIVKKRAMVGPRVDFDLEG